MRTIQLLIFLVAVCPGFAFAQYGSELKSYGYGTSDIVRDDHRDRVYCAVPSLNSVVVIDSESLAVVATIYTGDSPAGLALAPDGSRLYVANSGSTVQGIAVLDLETLVVSFDIVTTDPPGDVAASGDTVYSLENAIRAYNAEDGAALSGELSTYSGGVFVYGGILEISPDSGTLYYYQTGLSPSSWYRIDVSSWPGTKLQNGQWGSNGRDMALSADGQYITFASGWPYSVDKLLASDPTQSFGGMASGAYPGAVTYSVDGTYVFVAHTTGHIDVWNANTFVQFDEIATSEEPTDLECDRKGKVLFAGSGSTLKAYYINTEPQEETLDIEVVHAVELRWESVAGSLYQIQWKHGLGANSNWYDLGGTIVGTGLTMSVFDTTRGSGRKFYRVQLVSE